MPGILKVTKLASTTIKPCVGFHLFWVADQIIQKLDDVVFIDFVRHCTVDLQIEILKHAKLVAETLQEALNKETQRQHRKVTQISHTFDLSLVSEKSPFSYRFTAEYRTLVSRRHRMALRRRSFSLSGFLLSSLSFSSFFWSGLSHWNQREIYSNEGINFTFASYKRSTDHNQQQKSSQIRLHPKSPKNKLRTFSLINIVFIYSVLWGNRWSTTSFFVGQAKWGNHSKSVN